MTLPGGMMDVPLLVSSILRHAAAYHGEAPVLSRDADGGLHRTDYAAVARRAGRLAAALATLGVQPGETVGTLAWNGFRHLEAYFAISGAGMVCHTINPRLFPEQVAGIIGHARDAVLLADPVCLPLLEAIAPALDGVRAIVVLTGPGTMPRSDALPLLCYEALLDAQGDRLADGVADGFDWPLLDETLASGLCYTSGTTGAPKGALYSHRSTVLHAMAIALPDVFGMSATDVVMPVVPMFHVNAWGMPHAAPLVGASLVLPGPRLDGESLYGLIAQAQVTLSAGVPTVWAGLLDFVEARGLALPSLRRVVIGGSALPPPMIARFAALGVSAVQGWGMTETGPLALLNLPKAKHAPLAPGWPMQRAEKQGRPLFGVQCRVVDESGCDQPRDGASSGTLLVRGPWVAASYHGAGADAAHAIPGWFATGDVATMDQDGYVQIVDRSKDVIKSGGEWISSIALEAVAAAHPAVHEAAVIGKPDARWGERPLLLVVARPGMTTNAAELRAHFVGKVARWAIPDDIRLVDALPHTATGKLLKTRLRELYL